MTLTLLLDLDDTLLSSNIDEFVPVYFNALAKALSPYVPPEKLLKYLMLGTQAMLEHDSPDETLGQVFDRNFYPHLGMGRDILDLEIARFYEEIFPSLGYLTKPRPAAVELIKWAVAQGHHLAIATNPLFPQVAVQHRLRWAGLEPDDYPFEVISSFENFHFSKPNPAYLAEVLGVMGWQDTPVLMVGDDPVHDVQAAEELGIAMFWIAADDAELPVGRADVAGQGSVGELCSWIESVSEEILLPRYQAKTAVVATIKSTPAVLSNLLADLPAEMWTYRSSPDEWCLNEMLGHLRDVEREVNLPRIQTFLQKSNPFITADDTDLWVAERGYAQENGATTLAEFVAARMDTLAALQNLSAADWQRAGRHAIFGPITLQEQLAFSAEHDRVHLRQVFHALKKNSV